MDDRKVETVGNDQIWMSDDMTLMIPETMVNDLFQCTAARMDGDIHQTDQRSEDLRD